LKYYCVSRYVVVNLIIGEDQQALYIPDGTEILNKQAKLKTQLK